MAHHAAQPYGQSNGFWYFETDQSINLGKFLSVNAAFFMSLFFLISAFFLPGSLRRKGNRKFLKDKLVKFGIPLLVGFLIVMPILLYAYYLNFRGYSHISFLNYYLNIYFGLGEIPPNWSGPTFPDLQFGHFWFIEHLLVYSVIYCVFVYFCEVFKVSFKGEVGKLTNMKLFILVLFTACLTFLVRLWYPLDYWEGFLGFIQAEYAHSPHYISAFIFGIAAYKNNWMDQLHGKIGYVWLSIGLSLAAIRYFTNIIVYSPGGYSLDSMIYSLVETFLCYGLSIGFLFLFKSLLNYSNKFLQLLSDHSYSVYIFHLPILVVLQYIFESIDIGPYPRFLIVTVLGAVISYLFSFFIRKFHFVRSVI